jgi:DNA mismatch repair protein MutS
MILPPCALLLLLLLTSGRHPLTELLTDGRFIPNDTRLSLPAAAAAVDAAGSDPQQQQGTAAGRSGPRMVLITGPNASGKSVYMKQVGGTFLILVAWPLHPFSC